MGFFGEREKNLAMGQIKIFFNRVTKAKYRYDESRYGDSFVSATSQSCQYDANKSVQRVIYCCWTGDNEMSPDRLRAFNALKKNVEIKVELVTSRNLPDFILPEHPLHKSYKYLSFVHKADYLRCYLMHHYGGGYTDIKVLNNSWKKPFELLDSSPKKWVVGYHEIGKRGVALVEGNMGDDLRKQWHILVGNCSFICRPYTPFTHEWYGELLKRMDFFYDDLANNPGNALGSNPGYPIPWDYILGQIFHPLCLKYNSRLLYSKKLKFKPISYR